MAKPGSGASTFPPLGQKQLHFRGCSCSFEQQVEGKLNGKGKDRNCTGKATMSARMRLRKTLCDEGERFSWIVVFVPKKITVALPVNITPLSWTSAGATHTLH